MVEDEQIIDAFRQLLHAHGRWPTWESADRYLDQTLGLDDPWAAVSRLDRSLLWGFGDVEPNDDHRVGLSIRGLSQCPAAREDVELFIDGVRLGADLQQESDTPVSLTATLFEEQLAIPAAGRSDLLMRQPALWHTTSLWSHLSFGDGPRGWSITLARKQIRRMRGVVDVEDYLHLVLPTTPSDPATAAAAAAAQDETSSRVLALRGDSGETYEVQLDVSLGAGSQGTVFAATSSSGAAVAVKRMTLRGFDASKWYRDGRYAEREEQVGRYLADRRSGHVLPLLDTAVENDAYYLMYPKAEFSLSDRIRQAQAQETRLDLVEVRDIALQLAMGVAELERHQVVHRDLKPANALFHDGRWKWGDLAAARLLEEATSTYTLNQIGTPAYQAPEVAAGNVPTFSYSLGCTIYAIATGEPPFQGTEVRAHQRDAEPNLDAIGDERLARAVQFMLAKEPGKRPTAEWVVEFLSDDAPDDDNAVAGLRSLATAALARQAARSSADAEVARRKQCASDALARFDHIWASLMSKVKRQLPHVREAQDGPVWILTYEDLRLMVQLAEPAANCSAVQLGVVSVHAEGDSQRYTNVANVGAWPDNNGDPRWRLLRLVRNDLAPNRFEVSSSLSDGLGAVSVRDLEQVLAQREARVAAASATIREEIDLTADSLRDLFTAEAAALHADIEGGHG